MSLLGTLTSSVSALDSFTTGLDAIGNNIANVNTTAFKDSSVSFADTYSGLGTSVRGSTTNFSQGALSSTGTTTNLGISGNGYFILKDSVSGNVYATRDGQFAFNSAGYLVNSQGYRVQGLAGGTLGDIKEGTPPTGATRQAVSIDTSGNLVESYSDGTQATTNQVLLQSYATPSGLTSVGNNLYTNLAAGTPLTATLSASNAPNQGGLGLIQSGTLEQSNVDLTKEFANMITLQRAFEANARLITISDTVLESVVNMKTH